MNKIILIKKYGPNSFFWSNLIKRKTIIQLSVEEIIKKYQGFEGDLIRYFSIKKDEEKFVKIIDEYIKIKKSNDYLLLYISSNNEEIPLPLKEKIFLVGYDFGICEEEKSIYSSVFNEILFGTVKNLIFYKDVLNEHLLFPQSFLAKNYAKIHHELLLEGKDLENDEDMNIYGVWKFYN